MILTLVSAAAMAVAADDCPAIDFAELQPAPGTQYHYSFWQDGAIQPGELRIEISRSRRGDLMADMSFFLVTGEWTPAQAYRPIAGVVLRPEPELSGRAPRRLQFAPVHPPVSARRLDTGEEFRIPATETVTQPSGEPLRHEGDYVIRHAGCGELLHDGVPVQTRKLQVSYFRFVGQPDQGWTLTHPVQIYQIPVDADWFYAQHRERHDPMEQGTIMRGYTTR